ncbi:MAG TPA: hypothetical protein GXZ32_01985 [Clostridiales bacterium]|nr:hypothetical protein [Clostridiales bacterium]
MKYVYAVLTVVDNCPIMQTIVSDNRLTGRQVLDKVVLSDDEKKKYRGWPDEKKIIEDLNKKMSIKIEIQELEIG